MLIKIALIVSMCSNVNLADISKKKAELEKHNPGATVSVRFDKKCQQETSEQ